MLLWSEHDFERRSKKESRPYHLAHGSSDQEPHLFITPRRRYDNIAARIQYQCTFPGQRNGVKSRPSSGTLSHLTKDENLRTKAYASILTRAQSSAAFHGEEDASKPKTMTGSVSLPELNTYDQVKSDQKYKQLQNAIQQIIVSEQKAFGDLSSDATQGEKVVKKVQKEENEEDEPPEIEYAKKTKSQEAMDRKVGYYRTNHQARQQISENVDRRVRNFGLSIHFLMEQQSRKLQQIKNIVHDPVAMGRKIEELSSNDQFQKKIALHRAKKKAELRRQKKEEREAVKRKLELEAKRKAEMQARREKEETRIKELAQEEAKKEAERKEKEKQEAAARKRQEEDF